MANAKLVTLIETTSKRGTGKEGDPYREVKEWWTFDGELVVEWDEWYEEELRVKRDNKNEGASDES